MKENISSPDTDLRTVALTVGTAGHIDHGKTELVKFLTGCNTDCLPEEKSRGMTIDLGFATCELPDHRKIGIVDVPGHERFIHNMVAGASGIDVVIMVVAADDGIMPQTIEHFHIVRLLGVKSGMIVITKTDLVDDERVSEVKDQIKNMTAGSFLAECPVVGFSAKTGAGFDGFYNTFVETVNQLVERDADGPFRMHVERAFTLKGLGTIISGIPRSGRIDIGDEIVLFPSETKKTLRGIQVYGQKATGGQNGECVALKLSNVSSGDITRGMVLASAGYFEPTRFINAQIQLLPNLKKTVKPRTAVKVHIGTTQVSGHLVLPELTPMIAGDSGYVQLQLKKPVIAAPGDLFVVRQLSPVRTIGGGHVVCSDNMRMRRSKGTWLNTCIEREEAFKEPATAARYIVENYASEPLGLKKLSHMLFMSENETNKQLDLLIAAGVIVQLGGDKIVQAQTISAAKDQITAALKKLHKASPLSLGFPKHEMFRNLEANQDGIKKRTDKACLVYALADLIDNKTIIENDTGLQLGNSSAKLSPRQSKMAENILDIYKQEAFRAPRKEELPLLLGAPPPIINPVLAHLLQAGVLVRITDKIILHRDHLENSREAIIKQIKNNDSLNASSCKELLDTTRKYAIPIMEYWDKHGLTKRVENERILR